MERCVAPPIIPSLHKSADPNAMARCGWCMPHVSVIVVHARCASSVKHRQPPSKLGGKVAVSRPVSSSSSLSEASPPAAGEPLPPVGPHPVRLERLAAAFPSAGGGQAPCAKAALRSGWLTPLPHLSPLQIDHFLEHNGHITDFPGHGAWPAMRHGLPRLLSQSRSLGYRMPLPTRSDSRRADRRAEAPAWQVLSSVRFSFPSRSPCSLFHPDLLFFTLSVSDTSFDEPCPPSSGKHAGLLTDQRPFLFSLANRALLSALSSSLRISWAFSDQESDRACSSWVKQASIIPISLSLLEVT